jgi:ribosomal-protein-alanine N-acetyltransferase
MPYYVRLMQAEDVSEVNQIDLEAFPTMLPPPNYQHELGTRLAHYIVAYEDGPETEKERPEAAGESRDTSRLRALFHHENAPAREPAPNHHIVGFAGFWIMADEAHITNIAVRESYRRRGIGELLFIALIDLALKFQARFLLLEVRMSNIPAQQLYQKYGFKEINVRRGYYTDNKEDALVMSTGDITSGIFQNRLTELTGAHSQRWGAHLYQIGAE